MVWVRAYYIRQTPGCNVAFFITRLVTLLCTLGLAVIAIRGGTDRTTRPITLSNATAYVSEPLQTALVLNTPFCIIRTVGKPSVNGCIFCLRRRTGSGVYAYTCKRIRVNSRIGRTAGKPLWRIVEKCGSACSGKFFQSIYRSFAGRKPTFLYTFFRFVGSLLFILRPCLRKRQKICGCHPFCIGQHTFFGTTFCFNALCLEQGGRLGKCLKKIGYHTSFFHGAPNGSMGLDGMASFWFDTYYGMNEFGDKSCYDGYWGIWTNLFCNMLPVRWIRFRNLLPRLFLRSLPTILLCCPKSIQECFRKGRSRYILVLPIQIMPSNVFLSGQLQAHGTSIRCLCWWQITVHFHARSRHTPQKRKAWPYC